MTTEVSGRTIFFVLGLTSRSAPTTSINEWMLSFASKSGVNPMDCLAESCKPKRFNSRLKEELLSSSGNEEFWALEKVNQKNSTAVSKNDFLNNDQYYRQNRINITMIANRNIKMDILLIPCITLKLRFGLAPFDLRRVK